LSSSSRACSISHSSREVGSSQESYKPIITSPVIINENVIYIDVDNADNIIEEDVNDNHSKFVDIKECNL
jgi:hypothetical protein